MTIQNKITVNKAKTDWPGSGPEYDTITFEFEGSGTWHDDDRVRMQVKQGGSWNQQWFNDEPATYGLPGTKEETTQDLLHGSNGGFWIRMWWVDDSESNIADYSNKVWADDNGYSEVTLDVTIVQLINGTPHADFKVDPENMPTNDYKYKVYVRHDTNQTWHEIASGDITEDSNKTHSNISISAGDPTMNVYTFKVEVFHEDSTSDIICAGQDAEGLTVGPS